MTVYMGTACDCMFGYKGILCVQCINVCVHCVYMWVTKSELYVMCECVGAYLCTDVWLSMCDAYMSVSVYCACCVTLCTCV